MSCSIDEGSADLTIDFDAPSLPEAQKHPVWKGRKVQSIHSGPPIIIPPISDGENLSAFYQRIFIDLTFADFDDKEEEEVKFPDEEWVMAQALAFIERSSHGELTAEELLALQELVFDSQQGENTICKSIRKGINDLSEELCYAAKEVHQWCKEHPKVTKTVKIVAIAAAVVAALVLLYPVIAVAAVVRTEAIALAYTLVMTAVVDMIDKIANRSPKFKEEERRGIDGHDVPEASPFKSPFKTHLEDLQLKAINPKYVPQNTPYFPIPDASGLKFSKTLAERPVSSKKETRSSSIWASILNKLRQGLEIIGEGMTEIELRDPNTPLDLFHTDSLSNTTATSEPDTSRVYKTDGQERDDICITFSNGINNTFEFAKSNAEHIRSLCPVDVCIHGVYSKTNSAIIDAAEVAFLNFVGYSPKTRALQIAEWKEFHYKNLHRPNAKIMHVCHSKGGLDTINTLQGLPKEIQNRIFVISFGSADYVPNELCFRSINYASEKDFVPFVQVLMRSLYASALGEKMQGHYLNNIWDNYNKTIFLKADKDSSFFDHEFISKTYVSVLQFHLKDYISRNGEYE